MNEGAVALLHEWLSVGVSVTYDIYHACEEYQVLASITATQ